MAEKTTITVDDLVWTYLNDRKERGKTFNEVLHEELGIAHEPPTEQKQ